MRWKRDLPDDGDTRVVVRFALFPKTLNDDYCVWLEKYYKKQEYLARGWFDRNTWYISTNHKKLLEKLK